jgi:glycyl-tRNA synthetase beta chain
MKQDFLIEIGCEDLPAGQIDGLINALAKGFAAQFAAYGLTCGATECFATPRRLALYVHNLAVQTQARTLERRGPAKTQAFDAEGQPSKALLGFLQATQAKLEDLIEVSTDKGIWLAVKIHKPAQNVEQLLPGILLEVIKTVPMKKSMRWGEHAFNFLRPVHWLLMLYGKNIIPATLFGVQAGNVTYGHRFMKHKPIKISHPREYEKKLLKAHVVVSATARKNIIETEAQALVEAQDRIRFNTLAEVVNLVEHPQAILCEFKTEFLQLPPEVLISVMETHQRVFPIFDAHACLKAKFIAVTNSVTSDTSAIKLGNEKVIYARLTDAEFFYLTDAKIPLLHHLDALKKISFQEKLGSLFDKVARITDIAGHLAEKFALNVQHARQAAQLCKCDLTTDMVQEFPELQGLMGRQYALLQGISSEISDALEDHYKPKLRDGTLPRNSLGALLALADKFDTLVGLFGVGEKPTGSGDPYALRRQALGIIAIIMHFNWSVDLLSLIHYVHKIFSAQGVKLAPVTQELRTFFLERMAQWCLDEHPEISTSVVNAIKSKMLQDFVNHPVIDLLEFFNNARDLNKILNTQEGQELLQLVKRASNIIPQPFAVVDDDTELRAPSELALIDAYKKIQVQVCAYQQQKKFFAAYQFLLDFKAPLAQFFAEVLVMVDNEKLKQQRLSLLYKITALFYLLADFSCL